MTRDAAPLGPAVILTLGIWMVACGAAEQHGDPGEAGAAGPVETVPHGEPAPDAAVLPGMSWPGDEVAVPGLYLAPGGTGLFTPCGGSGVLPVVPDSVGVDLLGRWTAAVPDGAAPARVVVFGSTMVQEGGAGTRLRVDSFAAFTPRAGCGSERVGPGLTDARWWLDEVDGVERSVAEAGAWLSLDRETGALRGYTGCRDLSGRFHWEGTRLRFSALPGEHAMCEAADVHAAFLDALRRSGSYRLGAARLELLGEDGTVATLRAGR